MKKIHVVIITGLSGSGKSTALQAMEDIGFFCIDNLPPRLLLQLAELVGINSGVGRHLAVTCDLRGRVVGGEGETDWAGLSS